MSKLDVQTREEPERVLETKASSIEIGEVFFGQVGLYKASVYLRVYGQVVDLRHPRGTWMVAEPYDTNTGNHDPIVRGYRPAESATLTIS